MAEAQTGDRVTHAGLPGADHRPGLGSSGLKPQLSRSPERDFELFFFFPLPRSLALPSPLESTAWKYALISHMWCSVPLIPGQTMKPIPKRGGGVGKGDGKGRVLEPKVLRF